MEPILRRILVLDSDPAITNFLFDLLQEEGHRVDTASTVAAAQSLAATQPPDLLISDVRVWGYAATELPRILARDGHFGNTPVLFCVTLPVAQVDSLRAMLPPHMRILPKPFEIDELLEYVAALLLPNEPQGYCE
jgi:DNA-binding response OmpR family regulator